MNIGNFISPAAWRELIITMLNTLPTSNIIIRGNTFKDISSIAGSLVKIPIIFLLKITTIEVTTKAKTIVSGRWRSWRKTRQ